MEKFIVDTNFFFNLEVDTGFGKNSKEIILNFSELAGQLKDKKKAEFFMPSSIIEEFFTFINEEDPLAKTLLSVITIQSPSVNNLQLPASVFYRLVTEIRERSYRGLKVAEELIHATAQDMIGKPALSKIDYQKQTGQLITKLRERYRQATRVKFLDSPADLDIITLAKEINGQIISTDEGVLIWARYFGAVEIIPSLAKAKMTHLLQASV